MCFLILIAVIFPFWIIWRIELHTKSTWAPWATTKILITLLLQRKSCLAHLVLLANCPYVATGKKKKITPVFDLQPPFKQCAWLLSSNQSPWHNRPSWHRKKFHYFVFLENYKFICVSTLLRVFSLKLSFSITFHNHFKEQKFHHFVFLENHKFIGRSSFELFFLLKFSFSITLHDYKIQCLYTDYYPPLDFKSCITFILSLILATQDWMLDVVIDVFGWLTLWIFPSSHMEQVTTIQSGKKKSTIPFFSNLRVTWKTREMIYENSKLST